MAVEICVGSDLGGGEDGIAVKVGSGFSVFVVGTGAVGCSTVAGVHPVTSTMTIQIM